MPFILPPSCPSFSNPPLHAILPSRQLFVPRRPTISSEKRQPQPNPKQGRQLAVALAKLAADTRCTNVVVLDVSTFSPVTDFLVIATGTSPRQMRTVADDCVEAAQAQSYRAMSTSGYDGNAWICVDLIDVIVHIFSDDARAFYDLDNLWADAVRVEWES